MQGGIFLFKLFVTQGEEKEALSISIACKEKTLVSTALQISNACPPLPCAGNHTCGKCIIWVQGNFSPPTPQEQALLQAYGGEAPTGFTPRLACLCTALGQGHIRLPEAGYAPAIVAQGETGLLQYDGSSPEALGIAVDIGTTTIALQLYHLPKAELLTTVTEMNRQSSFGADVLSRIVAANQKGVAPLQNCIVGQLQQMAAAALQKAGLAPILVERVVITGNTTMLYLLMGENPDCLGVAPFHPSRYFGETLAAKKLFLNFSNTAQLYLPRCVGAYVGADIVCGIVASQLLKDEECNLLVDVGTNGEMALAYQGRLLCCATAAGPAFEGAQIAMGMAASAGAICGVTLEGEKITVSTIENASAIGICGTGIISTVHCMNQEGILGAGGDIQTQGHPFEQYVTTLHGELVFTLGESGVYLTQTDLRNVQLAKAAIAAGIETLLEQAGISFSAVDNFLISGGFGSYINPVEACGMGLFPAELLPKAHAIGNSSLVGAVQLLFNTHKQSASEAVAQSAQEISLSSSAFFMERYVENMLFGEL